MRERITIKKPGTYTTSSTGQRTRSTSTTVAELWAEVKETFTDQDLVGSRSSLERTFEFKIRRYPTEILNYYWIEWRGQEYKLVRISSQTPQNRWVTLLATKTDKK